MRVLKEYENQDKGVKEGGQKYNFLEISPQEKKKKLQLIICIYALKVSITSGLYDWF